MQAGSVLTGPTLFVGSSNANVAAIDRQRRVVAFLCTPAAEMIRGQTIIVDGGYTLVAR